ncbi:MAG: PEP-CTERM sorting domain-containing protein [Planctomycetota bacterium]
MFRPRSHWCFGPVLLAGTLVASPAWSAPIPVTFDFDEAVGDADYDTITDTSGGNPYTITDSVTGQSISFVVGFKNSPNILTDPGADNTSTATLQLAVTPGNGSGVNAGGGIANDSTNSFESQLGGGRTDEFIEFTFAFETTLVSIDINGVGSGEQYELIVDGGAPVVSSQDDLFTFTPDTVVQAGGTLRFSAIDGSGGESFIRLQELNVEIVPEPGSMVLCLTGLGLIGLRSRRGSGA